MKRLLNILVLMLISASIFAQYVEAPRRFRLPGEKRYDIRQFAKQPILPIYHKSKYYPATKQGNTVYIDTLYPEREITFFYDVRDYDSAYYVSGYTYNNKTSYFDSINITLPVRMKIDYSGNVVWSKVDSLMWGDHFVMRNNSLIQLSDGNFIQMGVVENDYSNIKKWDWNAPTFVKFNANGDTIWTKKYADTTYLKSCDWGQDIIAEPDGGYTVAALLGSDSKHSNQYDTSDHYMYVDTTYVGLIRYDSLGNIVQRKKHFVGGSKVPITIGLLMKQDDGGYIVGGVNYFSGNLAQYYLLKVDSLFNWQWRKLFSQINHYETNMEITKINNDRYFFAVERADTPIVVQSGQIYHEIYYQAGVMDSLFNIVKDTIFWMYMTDTSYQYYQFYKDGGIIRGAIYDSITKNFAILSGIGSYGANLVLLDSNLSFQWNRWIADFPHFNEEPKKLRKAHDGGYLIVGLTNRYGIGGWFVKTDTLGFALPNGGDTLYHIGFENNNISQTYNIKVYPNPANNYIILDFDKIVVGKIDITIFDLTGRNVLKTSMQNQESKKLDISMLTRGIYLLNLRMEDNNERTIKIIKN